MRRPGGRISRGQGISKHGFNHVIPEHSGLNTRSIKYGMIAKLLKLIWEQYKWTKMINNLSMQLLLFDLCWTYI